MRISFLEIEGRKYPLCFSLATSEMITEKYKNIKMMSRNLNDKNFPLSRKIDMVCDILSALMKSGCDYYNILNKSIYDNAPTDQNGKLVALKKEQLKYCIGMDEESINNIVKKVNECIANGQRKNIGTSTKGKKKRRHYINGRC